MRKNNNYGSMAPLLIFLIVILMVGFLYGVFDHLMDASQSTPDYGIDVDGTLVHVNTGMNTIMSYVWRIMLFVVLLIAISWLLIHAQKEKWGGV